MEFQLFQILKDDAVKVLHSLFQQIWKTQQWPQDWKRSVFIPIPKKGSAKDCSKYHAVVLILHHSKVMLKILQTRLQQYINRELPDTQAGFGKGRGTRDQIDNNWWIIQKARKFQKNFCFMDYAKEMEISNNFTCLLRNLVFGSRSKLEPYMEQWTGSKLGKEYNKAVYHPAYLTYMQSTSCKMPSWMNHKLESRILEEISTTSDIQIILP